MAKIERRRAENVAGNFYVDESCIDCDACRWIAPESFREEGGQSIVYRQPATPREKVSALIALVSCPTASIGTEKKARGLRGVSEAFPLRVVDDVYYCGYHSERSFGAASYFIQRDEGNILVDSPRFALPLVRHLEEMGGVKYLFLTHKDDVADHGPFAKRFGCKRVLHRADVSAGTKNVEMIWDGEEPLSLGEDVTAIPVPGHTKGHAVLSFEGRFLFTGDHLAWSEEMGQLYAFERACWYSWEEQIRSMEKLERWDFEWVLPGHGRRHFAPAAKMKNELAKCISWMKRQNT